MTEICREALANGEGLDKRPLPLRLLLDSMHLIRVYVQRIAKALESYPRAGIRDEDKKTERRQGRQ